MLTNELTNLWKIYVVAQFLFGCVLWKNNSLMTKNKWCISFAIVIGNKIEVFNHADDFSNYVSCFSQAVLNPTPTEAERVDSGSKTVPTGILRSMIKQVISQRQCFLIHHRSLSKKFFSVQSFIDTFSLRSWYLYAIQFSEISSSRLPVNANIFQFIAAASRKRCWQYEVLFSHSSFYRASHLHRTRASQASWSRLNVRSFISTFPFRSFTLSCSGLSGILKQITYQRRCFSIHRRSLSKNGVSSSNIYLHSLISVAIHICIV